MGLVGSLCGTYYYYQKSEALLEERVIEDLQSTAATLENFINMILEEQVNKLEIAATQNDLTIEELKALVILQKGFSEIFVLDSNGIVIACSEESNVGLDKSNDDYFINARTESYIKPAYFSETSKVNSISISTPFNEGVLVSRIDLGIFNDIVSERSGMGETGEALMGYKDENGEVIFFTERRFEEKDFEEDYDEEKHTILPIEEALLGNNIVVLNSHDYRHVDVIAVTKYIEKIDVGLVVKFDEAEVLGIARDKLIKTGIMIILLLLISFSIVGFLISKRISKPIEKLTKNVNEIIRGKLDIQLEKNNIFEIQMLTNSLNRILASLKLAIYRTGASKESLGLSTDEAVKAKEQAEDKYKILYESSRDAIMTLEPPTWNFTSGNPATIKMFGAKDEKDLTSRGPENYSPEKQSDGKLSSVKAKEMIMKAMKDGSNFFEWTHQTIQGKLFPATVLLTKVKEGGKEYLQATVRNITREKNSSIMSKKILESISDGFFMLDNKMIIKEFNNEAEKLLGRKKEDVIGKHIFNEAFPEAKGSIFDKKYTYSVKNKKALSFKTFFGEKPYTANYIVKTSPLGDGILVNFTIDSKDKKVDLNKRVTKE